MTAGKVYLITASEVYPLTAGTVYLVTASEVYPLTAGKVYLVTAHEVYPVTASKVYLVTGVARWLSGRASDLRSSSRGFEAQPRRCCATTLGKLFTPYCLCHQAV